jgi:hypothetical protein
MKHHSEVGFAGLILKITEAALLAYIITTTSVLNFSNN